MEKIHKAQALPCRKYRNRRLGEFLKELGLTEGRATGIPTIQKKLKDNGSAYATIETNEERSYFLIDIPCHPDFVGEDLSQVMSQVEHIDSDMINANLSQVVSQVVSKVKGASLEQVVKVFLSLQEAKSLTELMTMFGQINRGRSKVLASTFSLKQNWQHLQYPTNPTHAFRNTY